MTMNTMVSSLFAPSHADPFARAKRHTRLVRRLRWLLPSLSGIAVILLILVSYVRSLLPAIDIGPVTLQGSTLILQQPKLAGFDKFGKAYVMTAREAKQDMQALKKVELAGIEAQIELSPSGHATMTSERGFFDEENEVARLSGDVHVTSSQGYDMRLQEAIIDLKGGAMNSLKPVEVSQGENKITADELHISQGGTVIVFNGHVRAEFNAPEPQKP